MPDQFWHYQNKDPMPDSFRHPLVKKRVVINCRVLQLGIPAQGREGVVK